MPAPRHGASNITILGLFACHWTCNCVLPRLCWWAVNVLLNCIFELCCPVCLMLFWKNNLQRRAKGYVSPPVYIFTFIEKAFNFPPVTVGTLPCGDEHSKVILRAAKYDSSSVIPQPTDYETNITAQICKKKPANVLLCFLCGVLNFHLNILKWGVLWNLFRPETRSAHFSSSLTPVHQCKRHKREDRRLRQDKDF